MERVRLDYQRRETLLPRAGLLVLAVAIAATIAVGGRYVAVRSQVSDWQAAADQLENTAHKRGILVREDSRTGGDRSEEVRHANDVLRQLTLPWEQFFETIEASGNKDVALLSLAPDREKHLVRIAIEAKNPAAGLDYLRTLEARDIFQSVEVQSHQIQQQDPQKPIRFTLRAAWKELP